MPMPYATQNNSAIPNHCFYLPKKLYHEKGRNYIYRRCGVDC